MRKQPALRAQISPELEHLWKRRREEISERRNDEGACLLLCRLLPFHRRLTCQGCGSGRQFAQGATAISPLGAHHIRCKGQAVNGCIEAKPHSQRGVLASAATCRE